MAFLKINGFHTATTGRTEGIGDFLRDVDAAGVPFFAYCVDGTTSLLDAQTIMRNSDIPHHAVFRRSSFLILRMAHPRLITMKRPKRQREKHWDSFRERWPKELDPSLIYGETLNELRKEVEWGRLDRRILLSHRLVSLAKRLQVVWAGLQQRHPRMKGHGKRQGCSSFLTCASSIQIVWP